MPSFLLVNRMSLRIWAYGSEVRNQTLPLPSYCSVPCPHGSALLGVLLRTCAKSQRLGGSMSQACLLRVNLSTYLAIGMERQHVIPGLGRERLVGGEQRVLGPCNGMRAHHMRLGKLLLYH